MAIRKVSLVDSMCISKRENSHRNRFCKFNAPRRKNEPGRLSRLHAYRSYGSKPLNESLAGFNHLTKLHCLSAVAIIGY